MAEKLRIPYVPQKGILVPLAPVWLASKVKGLAAMGLVDSGATVNVLPYELGLELGLKWDDFSTELLLAGNLNRNIAKAVVLEVHVGEFPPVELGFAWSREQNLRLILGQTNFFEQFQVCFFGNISVFEISKHQ